MTSCSYSTCKYHRFRVQAHTGLLRYPQGRSPGCHWWLSCASAWGRPGRWTASPWSRTASWSPAHQEHWVIWWSWCKIIKILIQTLLSWEPSSILHLTSWTDFFLVTVILPPLSLQSSSLICHCHHNIKMSPVEWDHICQSVLFWRYCSVPGSDGRRHWVATSPRVCLSHGVSTIVNCRPSHGC